MTNACHVSDRNRQMPVIYDWKLLISYPRASECGLFINQFNICIYPDHIISRPAGQVLFSEQFSNIRQCFKISNMEVEFYYQVLTFLSYESLYKSVPVCSRGEATLIMGVRRVAWSQSSFSLLRNLSAVIGSILVRTQLYFNTGNHYPRPIFIEIKMTMNVSTKDLKHK